METRHALHGVRWPTSNPKCLNVDFGSEMGLRKAIESTSEELRKSGDRGVKTEREFGWERDIRDTEEREKVIKKEKMCSYYAVVDVLLNSDNVILIIFLVFDSLTFTFTIYLFLSFRPIQNQFANGM